MSENFYQNFWTQIKKCMQSQQNLTFYRGDDFFHFLQYIPKSEIPDTGKISWGRHLHYEFNGLKDSVEVCFHCETANKQFREKLDLLFQNNEELKYIKGKGLASLKWSRLSIPASKIPEEISGFASKLANEMIAFEARYGQKILELIQKVEGQGNLTVHFA